MIPPLQFFFKSESHVQTYRLIFSFYFRYIGVVWCCRIMTLLYLIFGSNSTKILHSLPFLAGVICFLTSMFLGFPYVRNVEENCHNGLVWVTQRSEIAIEYLQSNVSELYDSATKCNRFWFGVSLLLSGLIQAWLSNFDHSFLSLSGLCIWRSGGVWCGRGRRFRGYHGQGVDAFTDF